jgi:hypothetical protein
MKTSLELIAPRRTNGVMHSGLRILHADVPHAGQKFESCLVDLALNKIRIAALAVTSVATC